MLKKLFTSLSLIFAFYFSGYTQITAQITIDHSDGEYCFGDTVYFTNSSTGTYTTSHWFFGDGTDTWTKNPIHIYQDTGTYTVKLIISDASGNQDSTTVEITINPSPNLELINNETMQLLIAQVDDPQNTGFTWYYNSTKISNTDDSLYYYDSGIYSVTATNGYGCKDSASIDIKLATQITSTQTDSLSIIVVNNLLTPNNDGVNDVLYIQDLSKFTNPCQVYIYNKNGLLVYKNDNYTNIDGFTGKSLNGKDLPAGTYYYIIKSKGKKTATGFIDLIR